MDDATADQRENLTWERFGVASRELAPQIAGDGFRPDVILSIARGGLFVAGGLGYALDVKNLDVTNVEFYTGVDVGEVRCAVIYEKPRSIVRSDYVWSRTDLWINFPWSVEQPVVGAPNRDA